MKKFLLIIMTLCCLLVIDVKAENQIRVHVFTKKNEEISTKLLKYLDSLKEECSCFEYIEYQVWDENWHENQSLRTLADAVAEEFDKHVIGAPIMIVGNHFFDEYEEGMQTKIKDAIMLEVANNDYEDVIVKVKKQLDTKQKNATKYSYLLLGTTAALIGIIVILARKSTKKDSI